MDHARHLLFGWLARIGRAGVACALAVVLSVLAVSPHVEASPAPTGSAPALLLVSDASDDGASDDRTGVAVVHYCGACAQHPSFRSEPVGTALAASAQSSPLKRPHADDAAPLSSLTLLPLRPPRS